ncbi:Ankyrin repeat-containing domain protein [Metarhizium brunneum]
MTGLHVAAYFGLRTSMIALLEGGYRYEADVKDSHGRTPLWLAAKEGHDKVAGLLLENGASPNPIDYYDRTPLWLAVKKGPEVVVRLLLGNGADADLRPTGFFDNGVTPLHLGAEKGSDTIVRLLLKSGADQNAKDYDGRTPLWLAIAEEHYAVAELLLAELLPKNGANPDPGLTVYFKRGVSPLQLAVEEGSDTIVRLLLKSGADPKVQDCHGRTLLWLAVEVKQYEVAKLLLESGADVEPREYEGLILPWQDMEKEQSYRSRGRVRRRYCSHHFMAGIDKSKDRPIIAYRAACRIQIKG